MNALPAARADSNAATPSHTPLRDHVARSVRRYLHDINGCEIDDLYDVVLREIEAPLFAEVLRHCDSLCRLVRWGGDEFIMILPNTTLAEARDLAETIRHNLADLPPVGDFQLTLSFGVVQRFDEEQQTGLLARADQALYRSKTAGKNFISG